MLERFKEFCLSMKDLIVFVLTPIAFVAGYIYYLITKNEKSAYVKTSGFAPSASDCIATIDPTGLPFSAKPSMPPAGTNELDPAPEKRNVPNAAGPRGS